jgi:hypothetical protein
MPLSITMHGSFDKTERFLRRMISGGIYKSLDNYAQEGVAALAAATPVDTGMAAASWGYEISMSGRNVSITWTNSNVENGFPVVIGLQYGHGTGTGGYIQGYDFINPAIRPTFDKIAENVWKEVTSALWQALTTGS